jgi:hypothetical protein
VGAESWTDIVAPGKVDDLVRVVRANLDPYGAAVIGSAILVLAQLAIGAAPADAAEDVSHDLSGFQMGAVAALVASLSPRGEEFRRWWNLHVSVADGERVNSHEGAVLNPASMGITVAVSGPRCSGDDGGMEEQRTSVGPDETDMRSLLEDAEGLLTAVAVHSVQPVIAGWARDLLPRVRELLRRSSQIKP